MKKMKRRGFAKVEFLANKEEVFALRESGYTLAMIFDQMSKCGKFSMSYKQFCFYVNGAKSKVDAPAQEANHRQRFGNAAGKAQPLPETSETFVHDPSAKGLMARLRPAGGKKED